MGIDIDNITISAGYSQLTNEPDCIDLIFSSDLNITSNYGIEKTIHEKCHHGIIYGTLNFNVPLPPPYCREIWDSELFSELFNSHFAAQCTPVKNASTLPKFKYRTDKRLNSFTINENDIFLIIKNLNADKVHA